MLDVLLIVQMVMAVLLIVVILLQRTSTDGANTLNSGSNNMGVVTARSANTFLARLTTILIAAILVNSLVLANLSVPRAQSIITKIDSPESVSNKNIDSVVD